MNLYEELKKTIKELEDIGTDLLYYGESEHQRGKKAGINNAIYELYSLLWQYEDENDMERS